LDGQEAAVELSKRPAAFSQLIGTQVRDQDGHTLGRVFEVRGRWRGEAIQIEELMVGRRALWQRLRGPGSSARGIPWETVAQVDPDVILVRR
jgi:sporulation protein YlmC with PRC-barrel domain